MYKVIKATNEVREWYNIASYPDVDPKRMNQIYNIDWTDVNLEDIECILYDDTPLDNVVSISYVDSADYEELLDLGYEGGYLFTYNDGHTQRYAWKPYPRNLENIVEY